MENCVIMSFMIYIFKTKFVFVDSLNNYGMTLISTCVEIQTNTNENRNLLKKWKIAQNRIFFDVFG